MTITRGAGAVAPVTTPALEQVTRQRVSVVIPTLNEARNLEHVFAALPAGLHEVIVVDGHSVDGTPEIARQLLPGVRVITQTRKGKGNALACGFAAVTGDIVVMIDADGSTDPAEIPAFVTAQLSTPGADFAKGSGGSPSSEAAAATITRLRKARQPGRSAWSSTRSSAPATLTFATATTRSGPSTSRSSALPPTPPRPAARLGRRLRDRDAAQPPRGHGRLVHRRGAELRARQDPRHLQPEHVLRDIGQRVLRTIGADSSGGADDPLPC